MCVCLLRKSPTHDVRQPGDGSTFEGRRRRVLHLAELGTGQSGALGYPPPIHLPPPHDGRWGALSNSSRDTWLRSFAQSGLVADSRAFAIIEVVLVAAIIAIIAAIAIPTLQAAVDTVKQARGIMEIKGLQTDIIRHEILRGSLPNALTELGRADLTDPWGSTYQYALHSSVPPGQRRKDQFLVPINSRYDLYSMGKDKASVPPLTAAPSQDDIIIAADGGYVGLASGF